VPSRLSLFLPRGQDVGELLVSGAAANILMPLTACGVVVRRVEKVGAWRACVAGWYYSVGSYSVLSKMAVAGRYDICGRPIVWSCDDQCPAEVQKVVMRLALSPLVFGPIPGLHNSGSPWTFESRQLILP